MTVDLHIHSPLSGLANRFPQKDGQPDWDAYLAKLESLTDVPAVAITDYFLIDGYKQVRRFRADGRLGNIRLLLPNVEFRLDNFAGTKRVNLHVIFSDEIPPDDIEDHFLSNIEIALEGSPWQAADILNADGSTNLMENGVMSTIQVWLPFWRTGDAKRVGKGAVPALANHTKELSFYLESSLTNDNRVRA